MFSEMPIFALLNYLLVLVLVGYLEFYFTTRSSVISPMTSTVAVQILNDTKSRLAHLGIEFLLVA